VAEKQSETGQGGSSRRGALIGTVLVAALLGCALGASGLLSCRRKEPSTPLARVGLALQRETFEGDPEASAALRADVDTVRSGWRIQDRDVFDLVVAVRGLQSGGSSDWSKAEQLCRALKWPRCDRAGLEELKKRSRPSSPGEPARSALESAPALAVANATWAFGSEEAVRAMVRTELDRLPESEGPGRARVFLRFGIIDTNPDGQAALFAQACVADASLCDKMKQAAEREVAARFVPPGNVVPLYFVGGHPRIAGPR
jgi:hypothetical protein